MKAAIVLGAGRKPVFGDFAEPEAVSGEQRIRVVASSLSPLARARAQGTHYSSSGMFPFVAGVDGVGTRGDGRRVYFMLPRAPFGSLAEWSVAAESHCRVLPDDLDDITAAAIANPGMSSWAALRERARFEPGETVLINGATGSAGQLAVQIARFMGARRIVATGRNREVLAGLAADLVVPLVEDGEALAAGFEEVFAKGVDVVLDYLWGASAERMLTAIAKVTPEAVPVRFVQIGNAGGAEIRMPGAVLRACALELMGSGLGSVAMPRLLASIAGVFEAAASGKLTVDAKSVPLAELEKAWDWSDGERVVFTIG